jgi:hypothetical protein
MIGGVGDTYLAYSWVGTPLVLYDENPSLPDTIVNGEYYPTEEGGFYMEYTAWDGSAYWAYYTITANPGELFSDGTPTYFEIGLYSDGPSLYEWSYPRNFETTEEKQEGYEKLTINGITIELNYGVKNSSDDRIF